MRKSSARSTRPRRRSQRLPRPRARSWPQADAAPLQLFEDLRGLQSPLRLLHHPHLRGDLVSRRPDAILREAEKLVAAGTKELLVISQDTSAYGVDIRHQPRPWKGAEVRAHMTDLSRELGKLGAWVRLHYVYPYPHVDDVIPLMAEGLVLPYLDIPFQHASPKVLRAMRRPANDAKVLERIRNWRAQVPDLAIRSSFVVGFPGETEEDFAYLLAWLEEAQLDRVGAFKFEAVEGAPANSMDDQVPEDSSRNATNA